MAGAHWSVTLSISLVAPGATRIVSLYCGPITLYWTGQRDSFGAVATLNCQYPIQDSPLCLRNNSTEQTKTFICSPSKRLLACSLSAAKFLSVVNAIRTHSFLPELSFHESKGSTLNRDGVVMAYVQRLMALQTTR